MPRIPIDTTHSLDIYAISAAGFYYNIIRADNELFSTSLYEIDYIIDDRQDTEEIEEDDLRAKVLS